MSASFLKCSALIGSALLASPALMAGEAVDFEFSGKVGYEARAFFNDALHAGQPGNSNSSVFVEPEFYWQWNNGDDSLTFVPYLRADEHDSRRSHADIRELAWIHVGDDWELRTGIRKVFWGVTEFQHLVDVINQTDSVEDTDGEDKLGQQMVNLSLVRDWGILDFYLMPGFRERTFAGTEGRLRGSLVVDTDNVSYESSAEENHLDTAIRWSHTVGDFDMGLYWFHGTNRDPVLTESGSNLLIHYEQMDQFGLDVQATIEDWLWKFETIYRDSTSDSYVALQGGFEYTFIGVMETAMDVGILLEYGWDSRGETNTVSAQDDLYLGARLTLNDAQSTEFLAGIGQDLDHSSYSLFVEASRRFGANWKVSLDARIFDTDESIDALYAVRKDDMMQLTVERYF
ncbi:hypothetical protein [Motiliproteus sp. MSK22-1]|uniref:hypothetical protein n=1 Tax=Motiliproteus sp. MSK22-1 TaxID=1897630 RepID=UPI000975DDD5|nr:hypothetical protein [Motiliproteus sp. MSK22-1]OMH32129.1 hypothetical protein BGP75_15640 [Motiliproteus sp. MSK22-1]